jgi:asparagine synthase (glutamine-hydrolysing)
MCGLGGILSAETGPLAERSRLESELRRLRGGLVHRGPDASDVAVVGSAGLAHTRLKIIDLTQAGAQPMWSPDGRYVLAYNGEVYNHAALRAELEERGESFRGRSDTEVVLRLLALEGEAALPRLDGMFALALLDTRSGEVLLARDRAGQKPLYVAGLEGGGWAFASELTPLLSVPGADCGIDPVSLQHLLTFGFMPAPHSLRRGIRQLRPGTCVRLQAGAPAVERRYVDDHGPREPRLERDLQTLSRELEETLSRAVAQHLVADVPVGVLLSGGVDSSIIAALASRLTGGVKTFSVVHDDPLYDESAEARVVADWIGSEHHEIRLPAAGLSEADLDVLVAHHGDPFADSSSLNVLRLSREMRKHVTVALSGDGGDEVFAGYDRFAQLRWLSALGALPGPLLEAGSGLASRLPGGRARQVARSLRIAAMPRERRAVAFTTRFWPEEQAEILRPEWLPREGAHELARLLEERGARLEPDPVASAHWLEQRLVLPDDMLTKVDRMSMVVALEIRPPLLANDVLELAARLPFSAKNRGRVGKRALRALARRLVPARVIDRPKKGFALPLLEHGGAVFEDATRFALESHDSPLRQLFRADALERLSTQLMARGEGREPEDSAFRRVHRRWLLTLLARALVQQGGPA